MKARPKLCLACNTDGWACERHEAGDQAPWVGTVRRMETRNRVLRVLLDGWRAPRAVSGETGLHVDTVRRHVRALRAEGLIESAEVTRG
jgi:DNA-binding transcriptional ArsR family regulator